jgi:hypothetical protein
MLFLLTGLAPDVTASFSVWGYRNPDPGRTQKA